jgi:DNA invertase Pin-like site-specific DNA recombinase
MSNESEGAQSPETRRAVLYLRTASAHQADRDMAIVAQQHVCSWRAHELGATVAGEFVDFGSGLSIKRPGLEALLVKLAELRAQNAEATVFVIAADHARIARSVEAYSRASWLIDQAGAVLNIASIPLVEYEALARRSRPPTDKPYPQL